MSDIPELTESDFARAIPAGVRKRLMAGRFESGADVAAPRRLIGLSQPQFAKAVGISVHSLRNWEQNRRRPEGPALALLRNDSTGMEFWFVAEPRVLTPAIIPGKWWRKRLIELYNQTCSAADPLRAIFRSQHRDHDTFDRR
jgi:transcriptional regulator with XRE-family HTH domain